MHRFHDLPMFRQQFVGFFGGHYGRFVFGSMGSIVAVDAGRKLPKGATVDVSRAESDCGADAVEFRELEPSALADDLLDFRFLASFFFSRESSAGQDNAHDRIAFAAMTLSSGGRPSTYRFTSTATSCCGTPAPIRPRRITCR